MARYSRRPRAWVEDIGIWDESSLTPDLAVADHDAVFTGLLDASGDEIWREPNSIGFHADLD